MAKKDPPKHRPKSSLTVVSAQGRQPFLRGIVTHHLMQRGLEFDSAYAVAHAVRGRLADRSEIESSELWDIVLEQVERSLGAEAARRVKIKAQAAPVSGISVIYNDQTLPFSRGLLARSLGASGLDFDLAYKYVMDLEAELRQEKVAVLSSDDLARRVADMLQRRAGAETAQRYRLVRRIRHLSKPLVIFIGGASGTGKSTLALELAPMLRIYRVIATDTIRQVMRMVFSPQILPAIHGSSFSTRPLPFGGDHSPKREAIMAFQEQAIRIGVGIRAVVERAVGEGQSVLVEGVHLLPPIVPFTDLDAVCHQVPLMLATPDVETHRRRFFIRSRRGRRPAERYIEHFETIRVLHGYMLEQAEAEDVPLVNTAKGDAASESLRIVATLLRQRLPQRLLDPLDSPKPRIPGLLIIIDGLADRPVRALGGRTPLHAAETPNLDRLAREGRNGLADAVAPGVVPDTAAGSLALFGQSPVALRRGPVEAVGAGLKPAMHDIALRANFATFDAHGLVLDRRAGRIREDAAALAEVLDKMHLPGSDFEDVRIICRAATEHRLALLIRGEGLSPEIVGSDPGDGAAPCRPQVPRPVEPSHERAATTARILAVFEAEARKVLAAHPINKRRKKEGLPQANGILTRGAGRIHRLQPLEEGGEPLSLCCIGGDRTVLGLAKWLGADLVHEPGMTANLDTDLELKFRRAAEALQNRDLVVLHLKGGDIAAHDRRPDLKAAYIERVDHELGKMLSDFDGPLRIAVSGDHATLSESGQHAADPLPVLLWGHGIQADTVDEFNEQAAALGDLGRFPLQMLLGRLVGLD